VMIPDPYRRTGCIELLKERCKGISAKMDNCGNALVDSTIVNVLYFIAKAATGMIHDDGADTSGPGGVQEVGV